MRLPVSILLITAGCVLAASCNNEPHKNYEATAADSTSSVTAAAAAPDDARKSAIAPINSPDRKIIKTADLRCRVTDVIASTTRIEHLVTEAGGQISQSHLANETNMKNTLPYTGDSVRELQSYTTTARLTLRLPVAKLDSILVAIAGQAAFVQTRNLQLQDVTLQYLSNKLKNGATANTTTTAAKPVTLARKTGDAITANNYAQSQSDANINRNIENLSLIDEAAYATLEVELYQPQRLDVVIAANTEHMMQPAFSQRVHEALATGSRLLQLLCVGLLTIWPLLLGAAVTLLLVFRRRVWKRVPADSMAKL